MRRTFSGLSIQSKVTLGSGVLLLVVMAALAGAAYLAVSRSERRAARSQLEVGATRLVTLIEAVVQGPLSQVRTIAANPAVGAFLRSRSAGDRALALAALQYGYSQPESPVAVELRDLHGERLLAVGRETARMAALAASEPLPVDEAGSGSIGTLRALDTSVVYAAIASVRDDGNRIGSIVVWRKLLLSARLTPSRFLFGNKDGSLWVDRAGIVAPPPVEVARLVGVVEYERPGRGLFMASARAVPNLPWLVLVEMPSSAVIEQANNFLQGLSVVAFPLFAAALAAAWMLNWRITRPIGLLSEAAEAISAGDYSRRVPIDRTDELGRSAKAFNLMAARVQSSLEQLESNINERSHAEARFRMAVEASPTATVMINQAGRIVLVNAQTEKLFGYSREELLGQSIEMLVPERYRANHRAFRRDFLAQPQARAMGSGRDLYGLRKDGAEIPVEIGLNPIKTDEGAFVIAAIVDITARKRAQKALAQKNEEVEAPSTSSPTISERR